MDRLGDHGKVEKLILILILCNFVFLKSCGEKWNHTSNSGASLKIELYTFVLSSLWIEGGCSLHKIFLFRVFHSG